MILPVHNGLRFIREALACLGAQTRRPDEIVVVDDGSTDQTAELVRQAPEFPLVTYLYQEQQGPAAARNAGLAAARGEALAFLDADDVLCPGHLQRAHECLSANPGVGIFQGLIVRMRWSENGFQPEQGPYQFVNLGSMVMRREVFEKVGGFAPELRENEDTDWLMRAWEHSIPKLLVEQVSLYYRIHDQNLVHTQNLQAGGIATLLRRHLQRMRAAGQSTEKSLDRPPWDVYRGSPDRIFQLKRAEACLEDEESLPDQPDGKICLFRQKRFSSHRGGWGYALDGLRPLHHRRGVLFDGFVENNFAWRYPHEGLRAPEVLAWLRQAGLFEREASSEEQGLVPYRSPWVGFFHNPPAMPPGFHDHATPQAILSRRIWKESVPHCQGLFALSEYLANWLRHETGLPVQTLTLPAEIPATLFDPERFMSNRQPKIIQVGWWLRRLTSIYRLPVRTHYEKIWLVTTPWPQARSHFLRLMEQEGGRPDCPHTREETQLPDEEYDRWLSENLVLIHLYDTSANCALVECLARTTPMLINPHPAVVEYLGPDYPLYFETLDEAAEKAMDFELVIRAHENLRDNPLRKKLSADSFRIALQESEIYRRLRAPATQP